MSFVDRGNQRFTRSIQRSDPVTLEEFGVLLGQSGGGYAKAKSGVAVTPDRALGVSAWYRGARWLSETVASLPLRSYRRTGLNGRERRSAPMWASNQQMIVFTVLEFAMMSLIHRGNAFLWKQRNLAGQVDGLIPIHPDNVRFGVADGRKVFEIRQSHGDSMPATSFELLHIPALSMNGYFGVDPIRAFANPLGAVIAADDFAGTFYDNNAQLGAYISMPGALDEDQAIEVKRQWDRLHKGLAHAHEVGVIGDGATYHQLTIDAEQAQILQTRKYGVTEVARMLGVVPHKLYDLERSTFSNIEHQAIEAVTDSIRPYAVRIERHINADPHLVVPRNFIELELDGLLRGDIKTRYEAYQLAVGGPWLEANVPRRLENQPERPELDVVLQPLNMGVAGEARPEQEATADVPT